MSQNFQPRNPQRKMPEHSSDPKKKAKYKRGLRKSTIFLFLFVALGIFSLVQLTRAASQTRAIQQEHQENLALVNSAETAEPSTQPTFDEEALTEFSPAESTPEPAVSATIVPTVTRVPNGYQPQMLEKYAELYQKNSDLVGWMKVNCLYRINFAVVQGKNNYYMNHDFNKQENANGSAFLDETCKICPKDDNLIIYAHNMKSGEMFGELNQLQNAEKLYQDPFVTFDTLYEQGTYVPLAVFVCSVVQADNYFQFYVRNFKSEAAFDEYISRARELSLFSLKTDAVYGDELLTLVTCYDQDNRQRLVVLLRKLRENETTETVKAAFFQ